MSKIAVYFDLDGLVLRGVTRVLQRHGWTVFPTGTIGGAMAAIELHHPTVAVIDLLSGQRKSGLGVAQWARRRHPEVQVLLTTSNKERPACLRAVEAGWTPLAKPFHSNTLLEAVSNLLHPTPNDGLPNRPPDPQ